MSSCEFCEISKNTFFTEHLWTTASERMRLYFSTIREYAVLIGRYPGGCVVFKPPDVRNLAHSIVAYINCYQ